MIKATPPKISSRVALKGAKLVVEIEEIAVLAMKTYSAAETGG